MKMEEIQAILETLQDLLFCDYHQIKHISVSTSTNNVLVTFLHIDGEAPYYIGMFCVSDRKINSKGYKNIDVKNGYYVYIRREDLLPLSHSKLRNIKRALV